MASYIQADRAMTVTTPLGPDVLLLVGFQGHEEISRPFSFQLDLLAENATKVEFDKILGQKVTINVALVKEGKRYINGICSRLSQGERDEYFTTFRMEVVPALWLLTRTVRSRIFQWATFPDILKKVLESLDVVFEIKG